MRKLFCIFYVVLSCSLALAATGPTVTKAYADGQGWVHIITADGRAHTIKPREWQAGSNYSYPVAFELDVWRDGRVIRKFSSDVSTIQNWLFLDGGNEVAFHVGPLHGQEFYDCALFDVNRGKPLAHWALDRKDYTVPNWAKQLLVNDPPPGPDEISNWFPNAPTSTKRDPQSQQK